MLGQVCVCVGGGIVRPVSRVSGWTYHLGSGAWTGMCVCGGGRGGHKGDTFKCTRGGNMTAVRVLGFYGGFRVLSFYGFRVQGFRVLG